jgi:CHASE3 domain sensor protein
MARVFLSHSSANNAQAIALRDWLVSHGWDDLFLDLDPEKGLRAGERWQAALRQAAERCELVILLVSPEWAASRWCMAEFLLAKNLNKRIFGVMVEAMPLSDLPTEMTAEWQLVDLTAGERDHEVTVTLPPGDKTETVAFANDGLERLRIGLMQAGLDARYFAWPPDHDPERSPYRGLEPLEAEDAGIFFGRDGPIMVGLDQLRGLREGAPPRLLAILGASGAGKSSFLRAGLLPRLARESQRFLPLPVIRPERAVISGETGLIPSLKTARKAAGLSHSRAEIRKAIEAGPERVATLLADLVKANTAPDLGNGTKPRKLPTLVLAIDQAEELFHGEGGEEARVFLDLLGTLAAEDKPAVVVLFTIRSDSYELLQTTRSLQGLRQHTLSLPPMPKGSYAEVIKGPAQRLEGTSRPLKIDEALVDALLADIDEGGAKDALPLLAFTLERLYREESGDGDLKLSEYEDIGRVKGSIEAAVERALDAADADSRMPRDRETRLALLRRGLIPWLAGIDPDTGSPRRRIARRSEIPLESAPLIDLLVEQRLLATDTAKDTGEVTIEPAHEALLRQWGLLQRWLEDDLEALTTLEGVKRAARDWAANGGAPDWLNHTGTRLDEAEQIAQRGDLGGDLSDDARNYLKECRKQEDARQRERLKRLEAERQEQERRVKDAEALAAANKRTAQRTGVGLLAALALVVLAGWQWQVALSERTAKEEQQSMLAEKTLAGVQDKLLHFLAKAEMRLDTIWRLCSHKNGIISQSLFSLKPVFTSREETELIEKLNTVFVPLIDADPYISSMMIVGSQGFEYVALDERAFPETRVRGFTPRDKKLHAQTNRQDDDSYAWRNRLQLGSSEGTTNEWYWGGDSADELKGTKEFHPEPLVKIENGRPHNIAYDPRERRYARPWLRQSDYPTVSKELWDPQEPNVHWTPPYVFYTTKAVGITASRGWEDARGEKKYVIAVDFTLTELSLVTARLKLMERGVVFMFTHDGAVIGLPYDADRFGDTDMSDEALIDRIKKFFAELISQNPKGSRPDQVPEALQVHNVAANLSTSALEPAFKAWKASAVNQREPTTVSFSVDDEPWIGLFKPVSLPKGDRSIWIAVIAPAKEFGIEDTKGWPHPAPEVGDAKLSDIAR